MKRRNFDTSPPVETTTAPVIAERLARILGKVCRTGDFCMSGACEMGAFSLRVAGVPPITLPLPAAHVKRLIAIAEPAPYGRGEKTLVDEAVRRTRQINPERIRISGRGWGAGLASIVERVAEGLGVTGGVAAELYKLLLYDKGSFFVSHRDTEKRPRMFATLVIALPSRYTGGELIVRHGDRERSIDLQAADPSELPFAAFYADCPHEIRPVKSGCRLALVYNLVRTKRAPLPQPPIHDTERKRVAELLRQWNGIEVQQDDGSVRPPVKLVYPLEHVYTRTSLSFGALKGADAARAAVLVGTAHEASCDLHLALLTIRESGAAEATEHSWNDEYEEEDDEFEIIEVDDRSATLSDWRRPDGSHPRLVSLPVGEGELSPPEALEGIQPDEQSFQEATGNEGGSFERTYRRAALVLWPSDKRFAALNGGGLTVTLPLLAGMARRWATSTGKARTRLAAEAHELAGLMIASWPKASLDTANAQMLASLSKLRDTALIDRCLAELSASGKYCGKDNQAIVRALRLLPKPRALELLERIIAANAASEFEAVIDLLAQAVQRKPTERLRFPPADCLPAATTLLAALPGAPEDAARRHTWNWPPRITAGMLVALLHTLGKVSVELAMSALEKMLAYPQIYDIDTTLLPAALKLGASESDAATRRLRDLCLAHLNARIAVPLSPPSDWVRDHGMLQCRCRHCNELRRFLSDPLRKSWDLRASQADRRHVEDAIRAGECDIDFITIRQGNPHTLRCVKNQKSCERRVRQRESDLKNRSQLLR